MTTTEDVGHKFILVYKPKYCDSHSIRKGNYQFPDQAASVTGGGHGERGAHIPLGSEIRT